MESVDKKESEDKKMVTSMRRAAILAGIGMGLLVGVIMGLSVSEVVKVILGALSVLLAAFLGFDKRDFSGMDKETYQKDKNEALITSLRAGFFGLAVVVGIFLGMWVRTNGVMTVPIKDSVQEWIDAGYDSTTALKYVAYERLAINPTTGETGEIGILQRGNQSNLFSAEDIKSLCSTIDPDNWNSDWEKAKEEMQALDILPLINLIAVVENNIEEADRFEFFGGVRFMVCTMQRQETTICNLGTDLKKWKDSNVTTRIATEVEKLPAANQIKIIAALSNLACDLEQN